MKITPIILVLIALAVIIGIVAAVFLLQYTQTPVSENKETTTTTETETTQQSQKTSTTTTSKEVNIEGPWYGTYTSQHGTGRWAARIKKVGDKYIGILTLTGPYQVEAMGVQVKLTGNQITFGWAGGATFTGTVSGDTMSGTWEAPGGVDSGTWSGQRGETDITPEWPTETSTTITETRTTTYTPPTTTSPTETSQTTTSPTETESPTETTTTTSPTLPNQIMNLVNNDVLDVLIQVYGDASLLGYSIVGDQYIMAYAIPVNVTDPYNEGQAILDLMISKNYQQINFVVTSEGYLVIVSKVINGATYHIAIAGGIGSNEIAVTIYAV